MTESDGDVAEGEAPRLRVSVAVVVAALRGAHASNNWEDPALAAAVREFAAQARLEGIPPERLLITLKEATTSAELAGVSDWWRSVVSARVIKWAVEAYFGVASTGEVPRFRG